MMLNEKKLTQDIDKKGYTLIKGFFDKKKLNNIKNSLLDILNYISYSKEKDLQKKYYEIKKLNPKLKSNFYDLAPYNIDMQKGIHTPQLISFVKNYFKTKTLFSGRAAIHVHDDDNDKLLLPHQETNQFARDCLLFWMPLWDTNSSTGGLTIFEGSHDKGYFDHKLDDPSGKKKWTHKYTNINKNIYSKFKRVNLEVKAGCAVIAHSALVHCGYPLKKKGTVRITITERFNPLIRIPFLKDPNKPMKIPYVGVDYNKIED
tara:strand:- start:12 stop:791 length:780 start_codon:yes stop_codon:yes gene_type:complete